jgi:cytochrome oxidase Cu insertion factor (SCO1/SenC/PrrC family)
MNRVKIMRKILKLTVALSLALALTGCIGPPNPSVTPPKTPLSTFVVPGPRVGDAAPDFTLPDLNGQPVTLSQFRGKPVFLNWWSPT